MALPILDGNQSATTLSTILSSGQHIPAHTVVSLGTQAITDMRGAVSGSVVSISNFPATQPVSIASVTIGNTVTIAGTVTANPTGTQTIAGTVTANIGSAGRYDNGGDSLKMDLMAVRGQDAALFLREGGGNVPISGTVTVGNSVTIGSLPALVAGTNQIGSVTASISGTVPISISSVTVGNSVTIGSLPKVKIQGFNAGGGGQYLDIGVTESGAIPVVLDVSLPAGTEQIGSVTASISNSVTIASLPAISGTVTANTFALQGTAVTTSNFTSTTASTVLANFNATREVLTIFNEGAGNLHICAGATCTTIAYQVRLSAGDYYEVPNHQTTITHSAVFATAGTARVTQVS